MCRISVIVAIYNVAPYLNKCIDSVLCQSFHDFELLLVDDGSTDDSGEICDAYKQIDSRVWVLHKENGGLTSARLAGLENTEGEYILFIDGDDFIEQDMLEELYNSITSHNADMAMCEYFLTNEDGEDYAKSLQLDEVEDPNLVIDDYVLPMIGRIPGKTNLPGFLWIRLYSADVLKSEYFVSEREYFTEDVALNVLMANRINRISVIHKPLYHYVQHNNSLTYKYRNNMWNMMQRRYELFEDFLRKTKIRDDQYQYLYFNGLQGLMLAVDNIVKGNSIIESKDLMIEIRSSDYFKIIDTKLEKKLMDFSDAVWFYLLKFKCWRLLYRYRKWRTSVWQPQKSR